MVAGRIAGLATVHPELAKKVPNGVMHELKKLYYDVASLTNAAAFNAIRELVGTSQLLFGSDYPFWAPEIAVAALHERALDPATTRAIEHDNAAALLPRLRQ
jgi:predicted TIM-barrel fold metal-dependent hydrolase